VSDTVGFTVVFDGLLVDEYVRICELLFLVRVLFGLIVSASAVVLIDRIAGHSLGTPLSRREGYGFSL
jgi:hypothetical protein